MSIIDSDSVLILGAGVSQPFGLSLGGDLVTQIAAQLKVELSADAQYQIEAYADQHPREAFRAAPIHTACFLDSECETNFKNDAQELVQLLSTSTHDTIDDFIADNPSIASLVKTGIAATLFNQMYLPSEPTGHGFRFRGGPEIRNFDYYNLRMFSARHIGSDRVSQGSSKPIRNWLHHFINIVRFSVRNGTLKSKLKLVTFNYDTLLEHVLSELFQKTEYEYEGFKEYVDIAHMHGSFGQVTSRIENPTEVVSSWAKEICVVGETDVPPLIKKDRNKARRWISRASKVYAVGFAFSGANCRLIDLDSGLGFGKELYYCNYNGNMGITQSVKRMFGPTKSGGDTI